MERWTERQKAAAEYLKVVAEWEEQRETNRMLLARCSDYFQQYTDKYDIDLDDPETAWVFCNAIELCAGWVFANLTRFIDMGLAPSRITDDAVAPPNAFIAHLINQHAFREALEDTDTVAMLEELWKLEGEDNE
jgi:hypothetical protein